MKTGGRQKSSLPNANPSKLQAIGEKTGLWIKARLGNFFLNLGRGCPALMRLAEGKYGSLLAKLGMLLVLFCAIAPVWWQNRKTESELRALQKDVNTLKDHINFYQSEIRTLKSDPTYIEYLLRHELYCGYKNEHIVREDDYGRDR